MSRPTRYFDEGASDGPGSNTVLCFRCGLVGHIAKDCKNPPKLRPCYLCAGYGHASSSCPEAACYRCGETGHQARECMGGAVEAWEEAFKNICRRCGTDYCRAAGGVDMLRAEGKCNQSYDKADVAMVSCLSCGQVGHANCTDLATTRASKSCFNCGESGHLGTECKVGPTAAVSAERRRTASAHGHGGRGLRRGRGRTGGAPSRGGGGGARGGHPVRQMSGRDERWDAPPRGPRPMARDRALGVRARPMKKPAGKVWRR